MANYDSLKATIQSVVKQNGNNEITGQLLQQALLSIINSLGAGYSFAGVASPSTNPGTPDQRLFYITNGPGVYTNFDGSTVDYGEIVVFSYNGSWTRWNTDFASKGTLKDMQLFNANVYLYGRSDYSHTLTLLQAITAARDAGLNNIARAVVYLATDGVKLALFNDTSINSGFLVESNWVVIDVRALLEKYDELKDEIGEISQLIHEITDLTAAETIQNKYMDYDGTMHDNDAYEIKKYDVSEFVGNNVFLTGRSVGASGALGVFFDASNNIVGYVNRGTSTDYEDFAATVPANSKYVYVTGYNFGSEYNPAAKGQGNGAAIYTKSEADARFAARTELADLINAALTSFAAQHLYVEAQEILTNGTTGDKYVESTQTVGQQIVFGSHSNHILFNIPAGKAVKIQITTGGAYGFAITDANGIVLEYCDNVGRTEYEFAAHNEPTKLYVSEPHFTSGVLITREELKVAVADLLERVALLEQSTDSGNFWFHKNIWWCGTSIPAGSDATLGSEETIAGNYPTQVGRYLGCTKLWNKAVGGSMCRANVRTGDYNGANISNITSALSMTAAEVEAFIANYATLRQLPLNGGWPQTLSQGEINRMRAGTFEVRLLPFLTGQITEENPTGAFPDLFVIDHGHNDWKYTLSTGNSDIGLLPTVENIQSGELAEDTYMTANNYEKLAYFLGYANGNELIQRIPNGCLASFVASLNRNCFIGAVNFIMTVILSHNPKARFVFISNYEYEYGYNPEYAPLIPAQKQLADSWAFPLCEVWKYLAFSKKIVPKAKEYFATLFADTPTANWPTAARNCVDNNKDCFLFQLYCPDNVHPHSDISGDANANYAGIIAEFIKQCR